MESVISIIDIRLSDRLVKIIHLQYPSGQVNSGLSEDLKVLNVLLVET